MDIKSTPHNTLLIQFRSRIKCKRFLREISKGVLKEYIDGSIENTIWLKFPDQEIRDIMMQTLKDTVPKYQIRVSNGQEQMII